MNLCNVICKIYIAGQRPRKHFKKRSIVDMLRKEREMIKPEEAGWAQWLMLVILAIWEVESRRIEVQGQPGETVIETISQSIKNLGMLVLATHK
jgi:hypothetical protein